MGKFKFPSAYTILFFLIAIVAVLTWIIPAGQYHMAMNEALGKEVPVAGTYAHVEANPQGLISVLMAPIAGLYDPDSGQARAIDVALFILIIGGFLGIVTKTGAIDAGIERVTTRLRGREEWMIPILMALFAAGGTIYGMAEESLPFYTLLVPVMLAARFDPVVAASTVLLGAGIGTLGSTINPFATVIAANAAGIPFTNGITLRVVVLVIGWIICVTWVMRYARKVRKEPSLSIIADKQEENLAHFLGNKSEQALEFTPVRKIILVIFALTFAVMIYGVAVLGWWMAEISTVFLASAIIIGLIARMSEEELTSTFINGARDLLGVALIIGIARGIVVIMDKGMITHTILHYAEGMVTGLSTVAFINVMYWLEVVLSFLVPSSSGLAVLTMPIMAPLADFANVNRDLVVTAYQSASGIVNLITPTSAVVMGGLAIAHVPYVRYLKWVCAAAWDINSGNYGGIKSGGIVVICRMALPLSGLRNGVVSPVISRTEYRIMMDYEDFSPKEQLQLTVCQRLIAEKSYFSQEELRRDLQERGFETISQSTVSRLLNLLGVIKIRNAKGLKVYSLNPQLRPAPDAARTVSEMVVSVEHNREFILIHTVAGYGRAVARVLDYHQLPGNFRRGGRKQYRLGRSSDGEACRSGA
ncbi:mfs superfamily major facilitator transporter [Klebsiella pneumoniae]|uniref:Arginine repressor n=6 Tax=Enterobacteriaceae TaxID=543 RepID=A0A2X1QG21_KLEPN|nr:mfs superfamily major facilitator transporter [Klebsiella pneumoniae]